MTGDPERLRQALASGPAAVAGLFADHPDPTVRTLIEMWAQRREEETEKAYAREPPAASAEPESQRRERALRRKVKRLEAELDRLGEFVDAMAAALGACPICWGGDLGCATCGGDGRPGGAVPDSELYRRFVAPAARRFAGADQTSTGVPPDNIEHNRAPIEDRATTTERRQV